MAGIYIHIPYCKVACHYCNFHFSTNSSTQNDFVAALLLEISLQKEYLQNEKIETIYFGGGTPSVLSSVALEKILDALHQNFAVVSEVEITLEANPDDVSKERISEWKQSGINRFSLGIQSFFDEDLQWMNRSHNAHNAKVCLQWICEAGFNNTNIDLIYGIPGMSAERWQQNLDTFLSFDMPHLSAYCLTVEPKTALDKMVKTGKSATTNDAQAVLHFEMLINFMRNNGYEHYEISNFSKANQYSKHNTAYWFGKKYLGLGPSAHSFNGNSRQWNISNNNAYIKSLLQKNELPFEEEQLSIANQFNELLMTRLRTQWGIDLQLLQQKFSAAIINELQNDMQPYIESNHLKIENQVLTITPKGKFIADKLISDLMMIDE